MQNYSPDGPANNKCEKKLCMYVQMLKTLIFIITDVSSNIGRKITGSYTINAVIVRHLGLGLMLVHNCAVYVISLPHWLRYRQDGTVVLELGVPSRQHCRNWITVLSNGGQLTLRVNSPSPTTVVHCRPWRRLDQGIIAHTPYWECTPYWRKCAPHWRCVYCSSGVFVPSVGFYALVSWAIPRYSRCWCV